MVGRDRPLRTSYCSGIIWQGQIIEFNTLKTNVGETRISPPGLLNTRPGTYNGRNFNSLLPCYNFYPAP
ncbi:hypothetical protein RU639_006534 [Aspergillus parasiticus]